MIRLLFLLFFVIQSTTVSCKDSDEPSLDDLFGSSEKKSQPKGKEVKPEVVKQTPRRKPETKIEKEHFAIMQTLDDIKKIAEPLKGFAKTEEAKKELEKKTQERTQLEKKVAEQQKKSYRSSGRDYHDSSSSRSSRGSSSGRSSRGDSGDDFWKSFGSGSGGRSDSSSSGRISDRYQSSKADRGFDDEDKSKIGSDTKGTEKTADDKKNVYSKQEAEDEKKLQKEYDSKLAAAKKALTVAQALVKDIKDNDVATAFNSKNLSDMNKTLGNLSSGFSDELKKLDDTKGKQIQAAIGTIASTLGSKAATLLKAATYNTELEGTFRGFAKTGNQETAKSIITHEIFGANGLMTETLANARAKELVAAFNVKNKKQITEDRKKFAALKSSPNDTTRTALINSFTTLRTKLDTLANTFPGSPPQPLLEEFKKMDDLVVEAEGLPLA